MSTILLLDVENLYRSIDRKFAGRRLDYEKYLLFLTQKFGGPINVRVAYGSQKPRDAKGFISLLKVLGFSTKFMDDTDWNVSIALAAIELSNLGDLIILGSNHKNLGPLVSTLQTKGVQTFVCGCTIHATLRGLSEFHEIDEGLLIERKDAITKATE